MRGKFNKLTSLVLAVGATITGFAGSNTPVLAANSPIYLNATDNITDAINNAKSGDTIILRAGTYSQNVEINKSITLIGEDGAILSGADLHPDSNEKVGYDMINISADNVRVENLKITGLYVKKEKKEAPTGIRVEEGSDNVTISGCEIYDMGVIYSQATIDLQQKGLNYYTNHKDTEGDKVFDKLGSYYNAHGIIVSSHDYDKPITGVTVENCYLHDLQLGNSEALVFNGNVTGYADGSYSRIYNNVITDCDNIGIDVIGYEDGCDAKANHIEVIGNKVQRISSDPDKNHTYSGKCAGGIYVDGGEDVIIDNNFITNCDIGIEVASEADEGVTSGITVTNNTLAYNDAFAGISIGGYSDEEGETGYARGCTIKNNTIYNADAPCFVIQKAADYDNLINDISYNIFIAAGDASVLEVASFCPGKNSIQNNAVYPYEGDYKEHSLEDAITNLSVSDVTIDEDARSIYFASNVDLKEYGATTTVPAAPVSEQPVVEEPASEQPVVEEPASEQPVVEEPASEQPVVEEPASEQPVVEEPASEQPVVEEPEVVLEPSYNITASSYYKVKPSSSSDTVKISYTKAKNKENWKHVDINFENVDLTKYSQVVLTVIPSRKKQNLGITNQDENDPIFYRNHWKSEGKFTSTKQTSITIDLNEDNKDGIYLYFDATKSDYSSSKQTFKIVSVEFK